MNSKIELLQNRNLLKKISNSTQTLNVEIPVRADQKMRLANLRWPTIARDQIAPLLIGLLVVLLPGCGSKEGQPDVAKQSGLIVINVLDKDWYDDCHIKGSINVPFSDLDEFVKKIDTEKAEIVLYCSNYFCTSSMYACNHLKEMGFKHVWAYEGGTAEWYQLGLPVVGPSQRAYLSKKVESDRNPSDDACVITAKELAQKLKI